MFENKEGYKKEQEIIDIALERIGHPLANCDLGPMTSESYLKCKPLIIEEILLDENLSAGLGKEDIEQLLDVVYGENSKGTFVELYVGHLTKSKFQLLKNQFLLDKNLSRNFNPEVVCRPNLEDCNFNYIGIGNLEDINFSQASEGFFDGVELYGVPYDGTDSIQTEKEYQKYALNFTNSEQDSNVYKVNVSEERLEKLKISKGKIVNYSFKTITVVLLALLSHPLVSAGLITSYLTFAKSIEIGRFNHLCDILPDFIDRDKFKSLIEKIRYLGMSKEEIKIEKEKQEKKYKNILLARESEKYLYEQNVKEARNKVVESEGGKSK